MVYRYLRSIRAMDRASINVIVRFILYLTITKSTFVRCGEVYYAGEITDDITDCDGFKNDVFKCNNLKIGYIDGEDGEPSLGLSGSLELLQPIKNEYMVNLKVWQETDIAKELMYTTSAKFCDSLEDEKTPWWPLVQCLNSTECPIVEKIYPVNDMILSLEYAKGVLRHELCGAYTVEISITDSLEQQLSCHVVPAEVVEKTRE